MTVITVRLDTLGPELQYFQTPQTTLVAKWEGRFEPNLSCVTTLFSVRMLIYCLFASIVLWILWSLGSNTIYKVEPSTAADQILSYPSVLVFLLPIQPEDGVSLRHRSTDQERQDLNVLSSCSLRAKQNLSTAMQSIMAGNQQSSDTKAKPSSSWVDCQQQLVNSSVESYNL
jgi:hypothetical protein